MNKKTKITISIVGITIVLLALLGLTYAYYFTMVNENTDTKSVSSSTKKLELSWGDGNGSISASNVEPSTGYWLQKTFSITNNGAANKYTVVVENPYIYTGSTVTNNTTFEQNAFRYTVSCSGSGCQNVSTKTTFPITGGAILETTIPANTTHSYTLYLYYVDTGKSQNNDMGKNFQAKLNIRVPDNYIGNANYLSFKAYNNALYKASAFPGTKYKETPTSTPGYASAMGTEKDLSKTSDNNGTSYYYRGGVDDNYVNFANRCWRIVRIEGDGSIKLVLEDGNYECDSDYYRGDWHVGRGEYGSETVNGQTRFKFTGSSMASNLKSFQNSYLSSYLNFMKSDSWCIDKNGQNYSTSSFNYNSYNRIYRYDSSNPTFSCDTANKVTTYDGTNAMYVGALTADEVAYAGGVLNLQYNEYYLINDYQKNSGSVFWTLTPTSFATSDKIAALSYKGHIGEWAANDSGSYISYRPAVILKKTAIAYTGNGTKADPYDVTGY